MDKIPVFAGLDYCPDARDLMGSMGLWPVRIVVRTPQFRCVGPLDWRGRRARLCSGVRARRERNDARQNEARQVLHDAFRGCLWLLADTCHGVGMSLGLGDLSRGNQRDKNDIH